MSKPLNLLNTVLNYTAAGAVIALSVISPCETVLVGCVDLAYTGYVRWRKTKNPRASTLLLINAYTCIFIGTVSSFYAHFTVAAGVCCLATWLTHKFMRKLREKDACIPLPLNVNDSHEEQHEFYVNGDIIDVEPLSRSTEIQRRQNDKGIH